MQLVDGESLDAENVNEVLGDASGILVPGGFGKRALEGKILAAEFAREHKIPYLGICLGMQVAVCEFARNVVGLAGASSSEFDPDGPYSVIDLMSSQEDVTEKQRTVLLLYYAEGYNMREIGEKLGVDKSTVARTIKRGEARLRRCLRYGAEAFLNAAAEGPP